MTFDRLARWAPYCRSALRIMAALLFMQHGMQKYFGFPPGGHREIPFKLFSLFGIGGTLELFGGFMLMVGFFSRPVAFVLSGHMAVAYFLVHFASGLSMPAGFFPVVNGGDLAILFCFVYLYLFVAGPGPVSLDALMRGGGPRLTPEPSASVVAEQDLA